MSVTVVDGKAIAQRILRRLKIRVHKLYLRKVTPSLAVILVGNNPASSVYVKKKQAAAESIGIKFFLHHFPATISPDTLRHEIASLQTLKQHRPEIDGLIVQLPLPPRLWSSVEAMLGAIKPEKDIDCLTNVSLGKLLSGHGGKPLLVPPTPGAILEILRFHKVALSHGQHICLVGRGQLIGKPLMAMLSRLPVTVTVCGRATKNLAAYTRLADIIITGVGKKPKLLTAKMIKPGAVVIDASTIALKGQLVGDVDFVSAAKVASLITPVPGGVGPITVAKLLENVVINAETR